MMRERWEEYDSKNCSFSFDKGEEDISPRSSAQMRADDAWVEWEYHCSSTEKGKGEISKRNTSERKLFLKRF